MSSKVDESMKNILKSIRQSQENLKQANTPKPNSTTNMQNPQIQTHPLLLNISKTKEKFADSNSPSRLSKSKQQQNETNNNNNNKFLKILRNSRKDAYESNVNFDELKEKEKQFFNEMSKSMVVNESSRENCLLSNEEEEVENERSNVESLTKLNDLTSLSSNLVSNNNQNNNKCFQSECENEDLNFCSSEIKRKYNRANSIFYNGFLNKQQQQQSQEKCFNNLPEYQAHAAELMHFLKSLWVTNTMCDLSIVIGNRKYAAHRLGLAMFSRKYREEFQKQLQNKDTGMFTIFLQNTSTFALESILKYIYTAKIDINPSNVEEIQSAAKELGIDDLICMSTDYLNSLSIGDVLDFMANVFNKEGSELIVYDLYSYMMTHLDKMARTPEFLKSSVFVVKALLTDSHLEVDSELEVFDAAIRWITFDKSSRFKHLSDVMRSVRFTQMSPDELVSKIESYQCLKDNQEIFKMLYNAFRYHALCGTQSKLTSFIQREEARGVCLKGASVPDEFVKAVEELSMIAHRLKEARNYTTSNLINFNQNNEECIQIKAKNGKSRFCRSNNINNHNQNNNNNNNNTNKKDSSDFLSIFQNQVKINDSFLGSNEKPEKDIENVCKCSNCKKIQASKVVSSQSSLCFNGRKEQISDHNEEKNFTAYKIKF